MDTDASREIVQVESAHKSYQLDPRFNWIRDFLSNRSQRIKLSEGCYSEWGSAPSGVPQGTKLGPWPFLVLINDLDVVNLHV